MPRTWGLTFFLLDSQTVRVDKDALRSTEGLRASQLKADLGFTGNFYYKIGVEHPPEWTRLTNPNLIDPVEFPQARSTSAVLVIRTTRGTYAYTFGVGGRSLLRSGAYIPNFGKKTVLSIADPQLLKSVDVRSMREQPFLTRQQPTRGTRITAFGIDTLQDHLRAVTGVPYRAYEGLAKQVTGADSLSYRAALDFSDLGHVSDTFLEAYESNEYKKNDDFAWIDYVSEVRDQALVKELDKRLLKEIKGERCELRPPGFVDWDTGPMFGFEADTVREERHEDLSVNSVAQKLGVIKSRITMEQLQSVTVHVFSNDSAESDKNWSFYECIEGEVKYKGKAYVIAEGKWVSIDADFSKKVKDQIATLKNDAPSLPLACLETDRKETKSKNVDEGRYINRVASEQPHMYGKVHSAGRTTTVSGVAVEFCDLFSINKDIIHLKVWRSSQTFSSLTNQASNAAELLFEVPEFLAQTRSLIRDVCPHCKDALSDNFNPREYRVVVALIRKERGDIPFFSQLSLTRAAQRVKRRAMRVAFSVIGVA